LEQTKATIGSQTLKNPKKKNFLSRLRTVSVESPEMTAINREGS